MKYIKKNPEPAAFAQWKQQSNADWKPTWDNFQKPEKPIVHDVLLSEQRYTGTGEILSSSDKTKKEASDATIVHLNLNHRKLQAQRRSAIEGVLQDIETFTPDELKSLIDSYDRLDSSSQYTPFCAVIIYNLKQFIGS